MVILMGALATQGLYAGPQHAEQRPELLYTVFGGLLIGVAVLAIGGYLATPPSIYLSQVSPAATMGPMVLIVVGTLRFGGRSSTSGWPWAAGSSRTS